MRAPLTQLVAGQVRAEMARARFSGVQLADKIGRARPYVARRLRGELAFDTDDLAAISTALGVEVVDLVRAPERVA